MGVFQEKYSKDQKLAVAQAYLDRGIRPLGRVLDMLRMGELELDGELVPAVEMLIGSARDEIKRERRRRSARAELGLPSMTHDDAMEAARRRLLGMVEAEMTVIERKQRKRPASSNVSPALVRDWARALREVAHLNPTGEAQTRKPGHRDSTGHRPEGETRSGLGAEILREARMPPVPEPLTPQGEDPPSTRQEDATAAFLRRLGQPTPNAPNAG